MYLRIDIPDILFRSEASDCWDIPNVREYRDEMDRMDLQQPQATSVSDILHCTVIDFRECVAVLIGLSTIYTSGCQLFLSHGPSFFKKSDGPLAVLTPHEQLVETLLHTGQ